MYDPKSPIKDPNTHPDATFGKRVKQGADDRAKWDTWGKKKQAAQDGPPRHVPVLAIMLVIAAVALVLVFIETR